MQSLVIFWWHSSGKLCRSWFFNILHVYWNYLIYVNMTYIIFNRFNPSHFWNRFEPCHGHVTAPFWHLCGDCRQSLRPWVPPKFAWLSCQLVRRPLGWPGCREFEIRIFHDSHGCHNGAATFVSGKPNFAGTSGEAWTAKKLHLPSVENALKCPPFSLPEMLYAEDCSQMTAREISKPAGAVSGRRRSSLFGSKNLRMLRMSPRCCVTERRMCATSTQARYGTMGGTIYGTMGEPGDPNSTLKWLV